MARKAGNEQTAENAMQVFGLKSLQVGRKSPFWFRHACVLHEIKATA
ncbi:MAG TPA: hypothetical protein IAA69_01515 [Candidatus Aveggerthella stercoripullorum]|jgi:hypothetical protein|uniref:Uncharacterized protein n=1 Tax=Candidatus Aveggerthella stercoripullorum TaxID=2840688 RepID=A0A9D1A0S1_9ACTN|nr:hypothetical protein [Slackia piriformis]HIR00943.1 hypothetical protein [Candidatus Aveggerthella stercoripullorum]